jgi:cyclophilin family peptidyl-prolyl cis-trans isomerase
MMSHRRCSGRSPAASLLGAALAFALASSALAARAQIGGCTPDFSGAIVYVIETPLGDIPVELYPNMAPLTVANFQAYADDGRYAGALIHRSVPGFVIQGGGFRQEGGSYAAIPTDPPVPNEPCLSNTTGTIAMARLGGQPDSATSQWFVNLANNTSLDSTDGEGFTAFGRVVGSGMAVVNAIAALPRFDTLAYLTLPFNHTFRELPLFALPQDPPGGYGCSRASPTFGLFAENQSGFVADTTRTGNLLVPVLLDPQSTGSGATGPPDVPCTSGRVVYPINLPAQTYNPNDPRSMTCAAVAESEDSWAARRAGTNEQLMAENIAVIDVPEPARGPMLGAGIALLTALGSPRVLRRRYSEASQLRDRAACAILARPHRCSSN